MVVADAESSSVRKLDLAKNRSTAWVGGDRRNADNLMLFGDVDGGVDDAQLQHPLGVLVVAPLPDFAADSGSDGGEGTSAVPPAVGSGGGGGPPPPPPAAGLPPPPPGGGPPPPPPSGGPGAHKANRTDPAVPVVVADTYNHKIKVCVGYCGRGWSRVFFFSSLFGLINVFWCLLYPYLPPRQVIEGGEVRTLAGATNAEGGLQDGPGPEALFNQPAGLAYDQCWRRCFLWWWCLSPCRSPRLHCFD